ncbi:MAG: hypothetical protein ACOCXG_03145 [Nanoarchaeota archaeon]
MEYRKREIYIRLENIKDIVKLLHEIHDEQDKINTLMKKYSDICDEETKALENWRNFIEDIDIKIDRVSL